jgi:hypothetical protein
MGIPSLEGPVGSGGTLRTITALNFMCALVIAACFTSCSSRRTLTASVAKQMLQEFIDNPASNPANGPVKGGIWEVDYSPLTALVAQKTFTDYKLGSYATDSWAAVLQRLLAAGLAEQSGETALYPNLTGSYEETGVHKIGFRPVTLSMKQGSASIKGTFRVYSGITGPCEGVISGTLNSGGIATLHFRSTSFQWCPFVRDATYHFRQTGDMMELSGDTRDAGVFRSKASSEQIKLTFYSYSFSSEFREKMVAPDSKSVRVGRLQVDSIDNLLLETTDTEATGEYKWHVDLNDVGRAIYGKPRTEGSSRVRFRKQPDGDWVCVSR